MGKRTDMNPQERKEIVLSLIRREETGAMIARRNGISETTLYHWRDDFLQGGLAALTQGNGKGDPKVRRIHELEKALAERDRVIGEITIANRILKKTAEGLL